MVPHLHFVNVGNLHIHFVSGREDIGSTLDHGFPGLGHGDGGAPTQEDRFVPRAERENPRKSPSH